MLDHCLMSITYQGSGLRRGLGSTVKHMSFVLAKPYGPGLKSRSRKKTRHVFHGASKPPSQPRTLISFPYDITGFETVGSLRVSGADLRAHTSSKLFPCRTGCPHPLLYTPTTPCEYTRLTIAVSRCFVLQRSSNPGATLIRGVDDTQAIPAYKVWAGMTTVDAINLETCFILSSGMCMGSKLSPSTTQAVIPDSLFQAAQIVVQVP